MQTIMDINETLRYFTEFSFCHKWKGVWLVIDMVYTTCLTSYKTTKNLISWETRKDEEISKFIELWPSAQSFSQNKNFVDISKKLSCSVLFHMKTSVCLKYFVHDCRVVEEHVAYMTDIEAVMHQVMVPENQRSLLQFIWWKHGDPVNEDEDYEMGMHLFGGASSTSWSNNAQKRTSIHHQQQLGGDAAKSIQRKFYVDAMLNSSVDIKTAIDLIMMVKQLCEAVGFNLTKFVSNKMEVMQAFLRSIEKMSSSGNWKIQIA